MMAGKQASQSGHAFLGSFLQAQSQTPDIATAYAAEMPGTKVCLSADLPQLEKAHILLQQSGIPSFLVIDSGCPNFFGGNPIITALGFGPATKQQVKAIAGKMRLL